MCKWYYLIKAVQITNKVNFLFSPHLCLRKIHLILNVHLCHMSYICLFISARLASLHGTEEHFNNATPDTIKAGGKWTEPWGKPKTIRRLAKNLLAPSGECIPSYFSSRFPLIHPVHLYHGNSLLCPIYIFIQNKEKKL